MILLLVGQVKRDMEAQRGVREEEERLINLLRLEEIEEKWRLEEQAKRQKAEAIKAEIMAANEEQVCRLPRLWLLGAGARVRCVHRSW